MGRFVVGRLASSALLVVAVTLFVFVAFFVMPRNDAGRGGRRTPVQYRVHGAIAGEYVHYLWRFARHGDLGYSYGTRERVTTRLLRAAPVTLSLVGGGLVVWLLIAVPLGLLAALRPRSLVDRSATILVLVGLCAQPVWLGLSLSYLFGRKWSLVPPQGYCSIDNVSTGCDGLSRWASHLVLPWLTFGIVNAALFAMTTRALVLEELEQEYVRTAFAKGAGRLRIVRTHLVRNVTLPLVTMVGVQAGTSLAGVVFIESAFDLPGLGAMLRRAALTNDLPLTAGSVVFLSLAIVALNLLVDLSYALLDPRVRLVRPGGRE
jgi:peptide/nickel transport system permease protein